jgi:hypothetical protein
VEEKILNLPKKAIQSLVIYIWSFTVMSYNRKEDFTTLALGAYYNNYNLQFGLMGVEVMIEIITKSVLMVNPIYHKNAEPRNT